MCRHLAAELGAGDLLQGAFLQSWDPSRGDGTVEITSLDADTGGERSIVVEVADGSLRPVVAALVAALTSAQTASLLTADPADVLDVPSPWVWCFTIPEEHVEEFEELRSTCSLAVIEELERVRPEHWPHPLEDPPDELTTPEPGVPRAAEPISSPRRPPPPYVPRPEDRALWDETVATLVDLGFPLRHEAEMREYVLDEDYAAELREDPLTFLLDADGENSGSSLFGHHVVIDLEFVDEDGAYEDLLDHLAEAAGTSHLITDVASHLDIEGDGREGGSWISFRRDGAPRRYEITIDEDWGDPDVVERLAEDVTPAGHELETDAFEHFFWIRPEHRAAFFEAWRQRGG